MDDRFQISPRGHARPRQVRDPPPRVLVYRCGVQWCSSPESGQRRRSAISSALMTSWRSLTADGPQTVRTLCNERSVLDHPDPYAWDTPVGLGSRRSLSPLCASTIVTAKRTCADSVAPPRALANQGSVRVIT